MEAHESTRKRLERTLPKTLEDRIAGKGFNSLSHYNLVHKVITMPQAMNIPDAKAAVDKEWEKLEKLPAWEMTKVKSNREVIKEAQKEQRPVHFASLMDLCHLKSAELEPTLQKYKGRVVLRREIVKDDSGSYAVFTEQGSSVSKLMVAKVIDVIARLPGCAGQPADAVSAYAQVKMEDASILLKLPKTECPDISIRLQRHKWPKSWSNIEDPVVPLERNQYGHPPAGLLWERQVEKICWDWDGKKVPNWECLFVHRKRGLAQSVYVDDTNMAGREEEKHNLSPMWRKLMKLVGLGDPTSFLDHVYLGCTQRECKSNECIIEEYRKMFETRLSAGPAEKLPGWSYDMEGHAKK